MIWTSNGDPVHVLVETKGGPSGSRADRVLRRHGLRPVLVSKYCVEIAAAHPELPSNPWQPSLRRYFLAPERQAASHEDDGTISSDWMHLRNTS